MTTTLLLALLSPALAGAPEVDPSELHIVNGEEIRKSDFPSAVAIGFDVQGYGRQATCSASFITPRMLLTAAHCTDEFEKYGLSKDLIAQIAVAFIGAKVAEPNIPTISFADFKNHPEYSGSQSQIQNDIGVIELEEDADIVPVWIQDEPVADDKVEGSKVTSVGFGITSSSNQNSSGVKRKAELVVSRTDEQFLYVQAEDNPTRSNVCSGDSGGPQYHLGKNGQKDRQWGVHSFVFSYTGGDPCLSASGSTRVETFSPWILNQIERVHGTTDGCEINGFYSDRVCDDFCESPDPDCTADANADGLVSDEEFNAADNDGDGVITDDEALGAGGCSHTGGAPVGLAVLGLVGLLGRRRSR